VVDEEDDDDDDDDEEEEEEEEDEDDLSFTTSLYTIVSVLLFIVPDT